MGIAILDEDCFSLISMKFFIENYLKMNCDIATQNASEFLRAIDSRYIIRSNRRPSDVVADFFLGSGATLTVAAKLGRKKGIGVEREEERSEQTVKEITKFVV
ncbi:Adenine specific DNA methylase Mod [Yersinia nurmii]|uniref:Adenine specific DNA methylase Mod n=1 Tax=Yersinia nurmii TaxID=685706 RepID=A0ABM9S0K4_9GAMM|nr:DNA methyltransferase [Yersinia nurmii]CND85083.1 Adenine specific DNA methylase Mod [Yersinia nurmii]